ncbi:hypothetical protein ACMD2_25929, partial [Ananas comosus]
MVKPSISSHGEDLSSSTPECRAIRTELMCADSPEFGGTWSLLTLWDGYMRRRQTQGFRHKLAWVFSDSEKWSSTNRVESYFVSRRPLIHSPSQIICCRRDPVMSKSGTLDLASGVGGKIEKNEVKSAVE